jgi:hypothetical protein
MSALMRALVILATVGTVSFPTKPPKRSRMPERRAVGVPSFRSVAARAHWVGSRF